MNLRFAWDPKKNLELKIKGRATFEEAVEAIENNLISDDENRLHSGQRIFVVNIGGYPHGISYEIRGEVVWLITLYPARKYKK